jgi:hypothetical protein
LFEEKTLNPSLLMLIVYSILDSLGLGNIDWMFLLVLVIIGLVIIVLIKLFLVLVPAIIVAIIVYFLTAGDLFLTGIAFLVVALLSLISKI